MSTERAVELQERAWALQAEGALDEAFAVASEALGLLELSEGPLSLDVANLLNDLAEIERDRQRFAAALPLAERALRIEAALAPSAEEAVTRIRLKTASLLGELQRIQGEYGESEAHLLRALASARELGDPLELAYAENALAVLYKYSGRFDEALALYDRALLRIRETTGEGSLEVGGILHNIGGALHARGDFAAAEGPAREAWDISRRHLGEDDPKTLMDAAAYASVLEGLGRYHDSEILCRRALAAFQARFGPDHYEVAASLHNLGTVVDRQGRAEEAERCYREALRINRQLLGDDSPEVALTLNNLGRLLCDGGRASEAVPLLEQAKATLEKRLAPGHPQCQAAQKNLRLARGLA